MVTSPDHNLFKLPTAEPHAGVANFDVTLPSSQLLVLVHETRYKFTKGVPTREDM